tara:strand:+ start:385 stop:942 length:558 start_codon:yes stop_codon:yes gene_type:complete
MSSYPGEVLKEIKDISRIGYLQKLANKCGDFKVFTMVGSWTSKRRSVLECTETPELMKWLAMANYMQILKNWIVLDIDEPVNKDGKVPWEVVDKIITKIKYYDLGKFKVYDSGGKGYHIHIIENDLALEHYSVRQRLRAHLIKKVGADLMMKSEKMCIQIPGAPHRKTLLSKKEVYQWGYPIQWR